VTRTIKNTLVPVNRFPPEILFRILEYRTRECDLVAATQVCRYWRSNLISGPSLWTYFQFQDKSRHNIDRTLTYLERSKSAPINVSIHSSSEQNLDVLKPLTPHIARMRSLVFQVSHDIYTASRLFCNPAPLLQHLEIRTSEGVVHLPDNFLGQRAPSLRSVNFYRTCPRLEFLFPLPNLTEFHLSLVDDTTPFRVGAPFQFLSESPLLQKISVDVHDRIVQDVSLDKVISLESLVDLDCGCNCAGQLLPFLRLPRLKRLRVTSTRSRQTQTLADFLPYGGRALLAGVTKIFHYLDKYGHSHRVELSGNEFDVSFCAFHIRTNTTLIDWSPDQTFVPFGQIEDLKLEGSAPTPTGLPIDVFALENLRVLRMALWSEETTEELLRSLHPGPGVAEVPCRFLQEIEYSFWKYQGLGLPGLFVSLVRERKHAGYQMRLVSLVIRRDAFHQDLLEKLKEHVGEVRTRELDEGV